MPSVQPPFSNTDRASALAPGGLPVRSGRTKRYAAIVRRMQIALLAQDYHLYDRTVGPVPTFSNDTFRLECRRNRSSGSSGRKHLVARHR